MVCHHLDMSKERTNLVLGDVGLVTGVYIYMLSIMVIRSHKIITKANEFHSLL